MKRGIFSGETTHEHTRALSFSPDQPEDTYLNDDKLHILLRLFALHSNQDINLSQEHLNVRQF